MTLRLQLKGTFSFEVGLKDCLEFLELSICLAPINERFKAKQRETELAKTQDKKTLFFIDLEMPFGFLDRVVFHICPKQSVMIPL